MTQLDKMNREIIEWFFNCGTILKNRKIDATIENTMTLYLLFTKGMSVESAVDMVFGKSHDS